MPSLNPAQQAELELRLPGSRVVTPLVVGALAASFFSLFGLINSLFTGLVVFCGVMALFVANTVRGYRKDLRAATGRVLNSAFNLIGLGRLTDASQVLDAVELRTREEWAMRLVDIQRATIALRRGDMAAAGASLTRALERPLGAYARDNALYQLEGARALRAFVYASLGEHDKARADIAAVSSAGPSQDALARVALAEAMILEQQGKREELRLLLAEKGALLLEHTHPRERAIVRAFQRMVRAGKGSIYRKAEVPREQTAGEEPMLADWVAKVAPNAAAFVRSPRAADQAATVAPADAVYRPTDAAVRANLAAKQPAPRRSSGWIALAVALGLPVLGGITAALQSSISRVEGHATNAARAGSAAGAANGFALFFTIAVGMLPVIYGVSRGLQWIGRRRAEKEARGVAGGGVPGEAQLRALTQSPSPVVAAQAWLLLADRAERRADFDEARSASTSGLARLVEPRDRAAADIVYPDLLSMRAMALAAQGRAQEANAELASLGPSYPHFSRAVFRARLLMLLRAGDLRSAAQWVEQGEADLPLSVREELLADLVRASQSPEHAGAGEIERLKDELRASPELKSWIKVVAPSLLEAFEGATVTDMKLGAEEERERLAEEEAAALELSEAAAQKVYR